MRTLFILRGCPASGKDFWVNKNNLKQYTLSADDIRLLYQSPILNEDGKFIISQNNDGEVWDMLIKLLEGRMKRGEFIVINATHYRNTMLLKYKKLIHKYRYRAYVIDFTDVPLDELLKRNSERDEYKFVPEDAIRKIYALFQVEKKPTTYTKMISKEEAEALLKETAIFDYNNYEEIVIFGDIHGCFDPLSEWFSEHPFNENTAYIFTGDYTDRGIQNKEVIEFLIKLSKHKNVLFLEGNHEKWLRMYANDHSTITPIDDRDFNVLRKYDKSIISMLRSEKVRSVEFVHNTVPQIADIDPKELRTFCSKFAQMAYINFRGKTIFVCHGGIPCKPNIFIPTYQLINGVGKYEDTDKLYDTWKDSDITIVHAHRNVLDHDVKVADNIFNLCDTIEHGGHLRVLVFDGDGNAHTYKIKNNTFRERGFVEQERTSDIITELETSKYIIKKDFGDISSYNFTREAFRKRIWNDLTCKARGLFLDNHTKQVVMRSYNKFFNTNEIELTKYENLRRNLVFPMSCFRKENGFLAMVTVYNDEFLFGSKSSIEGPYVEYIKEVFATLPEVTRNNIYEYAKTNNVTFVFECINHKDNTHPIWYAKDHLILLDIIYNDFDFHKVPCDKVKLFADYYNIECKELLATFNNWDEFWAFKKEYDSESPNAYKPSHEGFVFEDAKGFMFKYKLPFYRYWKGNRHYLEALQHGRPLNFVFREERDVKVYDILKNIEDPTNLTIVDIEKIFYGNELVPMEELL